MSICGGKCSWSRTSFFFTSLIFNILSISQGPAVYPDTYILFLLMFFFSLLTLSSCRVQLSPKVTASLVLMQIKCLLENTHLSYLSCSTKLPWENAEQVWPLGSTELIEPGQCGKLEVFLCQINYQLQARKWSGLAMWLATSIQLPHRERGRENKQGACESPQLKVQNFRHKLHSALPRTFSKSTLCLMRKHSWNFNADSMYPLCFLTVSAHLLAVCF